MQLLLPVSINTLQTFHSFVEPETNDGVLINELIRALQSDEFTCHFIAGSTGVGRSHLLSASCHFANELGKTSILLPIDQVIGADIDLIDGLENVDVVCIDDLDLIAGDGDWETAIFNLFNALQQSKATLIITANDIPTNLSIQLPDLNSRLQWCTLFQLASLNENEKIKALIQHAHLMGFELSEEVAKFMLNRLPRKMTFLMQALNTLDKQSMAQKRLVTVPFVKDVLEI
jgi:DnaA family protein